MRVKYIDVVFQDVEENEIFGINLPSVPYQVGQEISFSVTVQQPETWNVKPVERTKYRIEKIEHFYDEEYRHSAYASATAVVTVTEIKQ